MINRRRLLLSIFAVFCVGFLSISSSPNASAVARTLRWSGTACLLSDADCGWSLAGAEKTNWIDYDTMEPIIDGSAPAYGDSLIFPSFPTGNTMSPDNDIAGLSIEDIFFIEDGDAGYEDIENQLTLSEPLTITGGIYNQTSSTYGFGIIGSIILGGDITIESDSDFYIGGPGQHDKTINLNGHTLLFNESTNLDPPSDQKQILHVNNSIIGTGSIVIDFTTQPGLPIGLVALCGDNIYTGTTNINSGLLMNCPASYGAWSNENFDMFGDSVVNLSNGAALMMVLSPTMNVDNIINVAGNPSNELVVPTIDDFLSMPGGDGMLPTITFVPKAGETISVPGIRLNGSKYFSNMTAENEDPGVIDLVGMETNNFTLKFLQPDGEGLLLSDDGPANGFILTHPVIVDDGDDPPVIDSGNDNPAPVITAPNTAIRSFIKSNPIIVAVLGLLSAVMLVVFSKSRLGASRRR